MAYNTKAPSITDIEAILPELTNSLINGTILSDKEIFSLFSHWGRVEHEGRRRIPNPLFNPADKWPKHSSKITAPGRPGDKYAWIPLLKACDSIISKASNTTNKELVRQAWWLGQFALNYCPGSDAALMISAWPINSEEYQLQAKVQGLVSWLGFGRYNNFGGYHQASDTFPREILDKVWGPLTKLERKRIVRTILGNIEQSHKTSWPDYLPFEWFPEALDGPISSYGDGNYHLMIILNKVSYSQFITILQLTDPKDIPWQEIEHEIVHWRDPEWAALPKEILAILLASPIRNTRITAIKNSTTARKAQL